MNTHPLVKDKISALTHFIAFMMALITMPILLMYHAYHQASLSCLISLTIFALSMIFLYFASTTYHTFDGSPLVNRILKTLDHCMIFVLIAGSYTPLCLNVLPQPTGLYLLIAVWIVALIGISIKVVWIQCPKWFSSCIYIAMGWLCVFAFKDIYASFSFSGFLFLAIGGIIYTIGGIIYALKFSISKTFGAHELFHLFVMGGSICHYIVMFFFI